MSQKVAYVTGGMGGIGTAICQRLHRDGFKVIAGCGPTRDYNKWLGEQKALGYTFYASVGNVGNWESTVEAFTQAKAEHGSVDVLVNNAGGNIPQRADQITDEAWDQIIELNLSGIMRLTRACLPGMMERKWGRVIHISSVLGLGGKLGRNVYSATKAALIGMARSSALDLGPYGVTVNCISPGPFLTELPLGLLNDEQKLEFTNRTAVKRWGKPEEIAGVALLLGTEAGSYITGTTVLIDGGVLANVL
jgi:acetoacetyl-CoA reductase